MVSRRRRQHSVGDKPGWPNAAAAGLTAKLTRGAAVAAAAVAAAAAAAACLAGHRADWCCLCSAHPLRH